MNGVCEEKRSRLRRANDETQSFFARWLYDAPLGKLLNLASRITLFGMMRGRLVLGWMQLLRVLSLRVRLIATLERKMNTSGPCADLHMMLGPCGQQFHPRVCENMHNARPAAMLFVDECGASCNTLGDAETYRGPLRVFLRHCRYECPIWRVVSPLVRGPL